MSIFRLFLKCKILLFIHISGFLIFSNSFAQRWNTARDYEPIVLTGSDVSKYLGLPVSQIFAYSYNQAGDTWTQLPLQIDEKDDSSHVWVPTPNNILDANDEIVFMARDMGDQVPSTNQWIDDEDSRNYERYEIIATDPNAGGSQAYLYFYVSSTLQDNAPSYVTYTPPELDNGADVISGITYVEGHNINGIPDRWEIPVEAGGSGVDILDRQKLRINATYGFNLPITEEWLIFVKFDDPIIGKVRICRRIWLRDFLGFYTFNIPMYYYPYSVDSKGASITLDPAEIQVSLIRQSFDLDLKDGAPEMKFYNAQNVDIVIDGDSDGLNSDLVFKPDVNWFLVTGDQGSILTLTELTELGTTQLYYHDDSLGTTADGTADTGDMESWGDNGILITGSNLAGRFSISYMNYFLSSNQSSEVGTEFASNFKFPLNIIQSSDLVPVEMASFNASVFKDEIVLNWTTLSESNNYGFEVQRRSDSEELWQVLGFINGQGMSNSPVSYNFVDKESWKNLYYYRLKQIDFDGSFLFSSILEVFIQLPESFELSQNYPNPFNPETVINYQIPDLRGESIEIQLIIYNLIGDEVKTLVREKQESGYYSIIWDGKDNAGFSVSAGTYVYRIKAGNYLQSKKMTLLR
jgi:hypothetical protein